MRLPMLLLLLICACVPRVMPAGPAVGAPAVAGDALVMADGARLPLHAWPAEGGAPRAVVLALHGFNDASANFFAAAAPLFTRAGVGVYAYDQRGFGAAPHPGIWAGGATLASDATAAARLIRARHPGVPLILLGESMGAAALIVAATGADPPPADAYVLAAPALWGRAGMPRVMRWGLWVAARTIPVVGFGGGVPGIRPTDNEAAMLAWGRDPLTLKVTRVDATHGLVDLMDAAVAGLPRCCGAPTLVLFGARDMIVPVAQARRALRTMPGARVAFYGDGWHLLLRDVQREAVVADVLAWIAAPGAALPSGADAAGVAWLEDASPRMRISIGGH